MFRQMLREHAADTQVLKLVKIWVMSDIHHIFLSHLQFYVFINQDRHFINCSQEKSIVKLFGLSINLFNHMKLNVRIHSVV